MGPCCGGAKQDAGRGGEAAPSVQQMKPSTNEKIA